MPILDIEVISLPLSWKVLGGGEAEKAKKYLWERRGLYGRDVAELVVPVRAVPTVRCSAKVKYCITERGWKRSSLCKLEVGSVKSPGERKSEPAILQLQRSEPTS